MIFSTKSVSRVFCSVLLILSLFAILNCQQVSMLTFKGHLDGVLCLVYGPDGYLYSGSLDKTIKKWDTSTGLSVATFGGFEFSFGCWLRMSNDGFLYAAVIPSEYDISAISVTTKLNATTGEIILSSDFYDYGSSIRCHCLSLDGSLLYTGTDNGSIAVWHTSDFQLAYSFDAHFSSVTALTLSPKGQLYSTSRRSNDIKSWNTTTRENLLTFIVPGPELTAVSADGFVYCLVTVVEMISKIDPNTGAKIMWFGTISGGSLSSFFLSEDGSSLYGSYGDRSVKKWNTTTGENVISFVGHSSSVSQVVPGSQGFIYSSSYDTRIKKWKDTLETTTYSDTLLTFDSTLFFPNLYFLFVSSNDYVFSCGYSTYLLQWNSTTGDQLNGFAFEICEVFVLVYTDDGFVYSAGRACYPDSSSVMKHELETGNKLLGYNESSNIAALAVSSDGYLYTIACSDVEQIVRRRHSVSGILEAEFKLNKGQTCSGILPTANGYIFVTDDNLIHKLNSTSGQTLKTFFGHLGFVMKLLLDSGDFLYSSSADSTIRKWDVNTGETVQRFIGHGESVNSLLIANGTLFSGSSDWMIKKWDTDTGEEIFTYFGRRGPVSEIFEAKGFLYSMHGYEVVLKWDSTLRNSILPKSSSTLTFTTTLNASILQSEGIQVETTETFKPETTKTLKLENTSNSVRGYKASAESSQNRDYLTLLIASLSVSAVIAIVVLIYIIRRRLLFKKTLANQVTSSMVEEKGMLKVSSLDSSSKQTTNYSATTKDSVTKKDDDRTEFGTAKTFVQSKEYGTAKTFGQSTEYGTAKTFVQPTEYGTAKTFFQVVPGSTVTATAVTNDALSVPAYLEMSEQDFIIAEKLGEGGSSTAYLAEGISEQAKAYGKRIVAKVIKVSEENKAKQYKLFEQEVAILAYLRSSEQIATIVGFCRTTDFIILLKYYSQGSSIS
jgi:WD40 repeat protein